MPQSYYDVIRKALSCVLQNHDTEHLNVQDTHVYASKECHILKSLADGGLCYGPVGYEIV
jgi:hypothetical protein